MSKKKRLRWILGGAFQPETRFSEVEAVLGDLGYFRVDVSSGSHRVFARDGETEQKIVPTVKGRTAKKCYLEKIRANAVRILGPNFEPPDGDDDGTHDE